MLYLVIRSPIANRTNVTGRTTGWKAALNSLAMFHGDRITPTEATITTPHTKIRTAPKGESASGPDTPSVLGGKDHW